MSRSPTRQNSPKAAIPARKHPKLIYGVTFSAIGFSSGLTGQYIRANKKQPWVFFLWDNNLTWMTRRQIRRKRRPGDRSVGMLLSQVRGMIARVIAKAPKEKHPPEGERFIPPYTRL